MQDKITIETEVLVYKSKIGIMEQKILRTGVLCSTAEIKFALFDLKARKLVLPSEDWLRAVGCLT